MKDGRLSLGRVFGVPVYVHFSWFVIFGLLTWTLAVGYFPEYHPGVPATGHWARALVAALLSFGSILLHEMAHAWVAIRHGVRMRGITLFIFGGVAHMEGDAPDGWTEFKIAAVGPLLSVALAGLFYAVAAALPAGQPPRAVFFYLALINLVLAVFNLLPAFPLDGGRLLRGLLWPRLGKVRATRIAAGAGTAFAYFLIATGALRLLAGAGVAGIWQILIGWFLRDASTEAYQGARLDETLRGVKVRDAMVAEVETLPAHISVGEAAREHFLRSGYGGYPVMRGDELIGLLCLRDVLRLPEDQREVTSVQAVALPLAAGIAVSPEEPLRAAVARMAERGTGRLLVVEDGRLAGLLSMSSVVRHLRVREELSA